MKQTLIALVLVLVACGMVQAQPDVTAALGVTAIVNGKWQVTLDVPNLNFTGDPGASLGPTTVTANVLTNRKVAWFLQINKSSGVASGDLYDAAVTDSIPSSAFTFAGSGGVADPAGWADGEIPATADATVAGYTADATEQKNLPAGTDLATAYSLAIPADQSAGTFTGTITYTLTVTNP